ncbi:MAG: hypothetical protein OXF30_00940 [Candidatus Saccharibacteria bacterium]|nr:hypothetical protein [Candidatus Saccharibacteria bacterium]
MKSKEHQSAKSEKEEEIIPSNSREEENRRQLLRHWQTKANRISDNRYRNQLLDRYSWEDFDGA